MTPAWYAEDAAPRLRYPRRIVTALAFLSLILVGGDLLSFEVLGFTARIATIPILLGYIVLLLSGINTTRLPPPVFFAIVVMLMAMLASTPLSIDRGRTLAYLMLAIFCFLVMVPFFYQYAKRVTPAQSLRLWFFSFRLQSILLFLEFLIYLNFSTQDRPHIWFYEPSYAAIYFSSYFASSLYLAMNLGRKYWLDLAISISSCILLASATAAFALLIGVAVCSFLSVHLIRNAIVGSLAIALILIGLVTLYSETELFRLSIGYLIEAISRGDALQAILERAGTRVPRIIWGWDAFQQNVFFGIGFGADQTYTRINPVPPTAEPFIRGWDDVVGNPFTNPFVEAAGTMGLPGLIAMILFARVFAKQFFNGASNEIKETLLVKAMAVGLIVMFCTLQLEGTFLRYYFWALFATVAGANSWLRYQKIIRQCY